MVRRKNFIPTIILMLLSWGGLGHVIYKTSPHTPLPIATPLPIPPIPLAFFLLFLALFLSFTLLFNNTRRGILIALGITSLALLRFFKLFHPLYLVLVVGLLVTIELYFLKK